MAVQMITRTLLRLVSRETTIVSTNVLPEGVKGTRRFFSSPACSLFSHSHSSNQIQSPTFATQLTNSSTHLGNLIPAPPRRHLTTTSSLRNGRPVIKRWYESVSIASGGPNSFEILVDGKKLKTLSGNVLSIPNHSLAVAVATEWDSQVVQDCPD